MWQFNKKSHQLCHRLKNIIILIDIQQLMQEPILIIYRRSSYHTDDQYPIIVAYPNNDS